jgi:predicted nuclease of predicted toxin-antitoxin system
MRLLVDMNLSPRWAKLLTDAGIEAAHWSALGKPNARDIDIMDFVRANSYVVLTHDLDFGAAPKVWLMEAADRRLDSCCINDREIG